jgi:hypothetical protein
VVSEESFTLDASQSLPDAATGVCVGQWTQTGGPTVGAILPGYSATVSAPTTTAAVTLTFQFGLTCSPAASNPTSEPVVVELAPSECALVLLA